MDVIKIAFGTDAGVSKHGRNAVDGDPLSDVTVLQRAPFVMKDGVEFRDGTR